MPTKTTRKATADKRRSGKGKRTIDEMLQKSREAHSVRAYREHLPFGVHVADDCFPMPGAVKSETHCPLDWTHRQAAVGDAVLRAGLRLSVATPSEFVANTAAAIARALKVPAYMTYDDSNERIIVWCDEDVIEIDEDEAD